VKNELTLENDEVALIGDQLDILSEELDEEENTAITAGAGELDEGWEMD
jgi:hypothetical protein